MKKEPWRWIVFGLSVAYILYMFISKSGGGSLPSGGLLPMAVTGIAVMAVKVALIAGGILLLRWLVSKLKK